MMFSTLQWNEFSRLFTPSILRGRAALVGVLLAAGLGSVQAQGVQQPVAGARPAAAMQAAPAAGQVMVDQGPISPGVLLGLGTQAVQAIDSARYRELWSLASTAVRAVVPEGDFVQGVTQMRSRDGVAPSRRTWIRLDLQQQPSKPEQRTPGGLFANCLFESQFGNVMRREMVSFRLDEDRQWRFAGYYVQ